LFEVAIIFGVYHAIYASNEEGVFPLNVLKPEISVQKILAKAVAIKNF